MGSEGVGQPLQACYVKSLSQEHGIVKVSQAYWKDFRVGGLLYIIPVHSCLTVDVIPDLITFDGKLIDGMKTLNLDRCYDTVKE